MRHTLRRSLLLVWFTLCVVAAGNASLQMFTTFATHHNDDADAARDESRTIERLRWYWAGPVFVSSGLLFVTSAALLAQGWRRPGDA